MSILARIKSPEFLTSVGFELPPDAMREVLIRTPEFESFKEEYKGGRITDAVIRRFVEELMTTFRKGRKFRYDVTLAFLSAAMETILNPFSKEFLQGLSNVNIAELPLSPRVATICFENQLKLPSIRVKEFNLGIIEASSVFGLVPIFRGGSGQPNDMVPACPS